MNVFLRIDGCIVLHDDEDGLAYSLQPDDAFALETFIAEHRNEINDAAVVSRKVNAYNVLGGLVAAGYPVPESTRICWDGRLELHISSVAEFDQWAAVIDGTSTVDEHPTLGKRSIATGTHLRVQGPWVAAEAVSA